MSARACEPAVHDDLGDLPPFARSGSVAEEEALAVGVSVLAEFQRGAFLAHLELTRKIARKCLGSVDQCLALRFGQQAKIGRADVSTPVTNAHLVVRLLLAQQTTYR